MDDLKPFLETILELAGPWFIDEITSDQEQVRIDISLDFRKGGTFSCPLCGTGGCKVHNASSSTRPISTPAFPVSPALPMGSIRPRCPGLGRVAALPCFLRPSPCP